MTEDRIERLAEAMQDGLDRRYIEGAMTQAQYDARCREIADWVAARTREVVA